jgi:hypothetical protein
MIEIKKILIFAKTMRNVKAIGTNIERKTTMDFAKLVLDFKNWKNKA